MYDDYHETHYTDAEVLELLEKYVCWCEDNDQDPEIADREHVTEDNISHIAYHANLV